ncbi:MAG: FkbM family methyltransferase [Thermoplasmatales archaeon]
MVSKEDAESRENDKNLQQGEGDDRVSLVRIIKIYRRAYSNWFSVLYHMFRVRSEVEDKSNIKVKVILRGTNETVEAPYKVVDAYAVAKSIQNPRIHDLTIDKNLLCLSYENYNLKFDLGNGGDIFAPLFNEEYNFLTVKGVNVVDIGANLGGSAIFFAIKGARKVISLEPYPYTFGLATKNISSSGFKDKIEIINAGYGEDKKIKIDTSFIPDNGSDLRESENGPDINLYSLKTLMNKYNIDSGILKMDCEGCEYNLLNEDDETIKKFTMIQIEYHYGYEKLVDKLKECGFTVKYTEPKESYNTSAGKTMMIGYIYAERQPVK